MGNVTLWRRLLNLFRRAPVECAFCGNVLDAKALRCDECGWETDRGRRSAAYVPLSL